MRQRVAAVDAVAAARGWIRRHLSPGDAGRGPVTRGGPSYAGRVSAARLNTAGGPHLQVVAAVVFDGGDVLACRRNRDRAAGGLWEFPGGKVEQGETLREALVREIGEELDTAIVIDDELTTDDTPVGDRVIRLTCLRAHLDGPRPVRSSDHDLLLWLPPAELARLEWAQPDLPAVRLLLAETVAG